ncbi:thioesterase family protein [Acinetobacter ursingii]|uniref:Thioesterase family protein n=1 Tax=Acinetobacter ursingii TaxID=108980 RepID=A0A3G9FNX3_9GAMM|nr:thioesterase family protein [Acinetobacter ursingii]QQT86860.1 thioesterase family protein [Acinetobacter ursingii]BBF77402.1 TesB-like acyl-CoA thioesterase 1 [Acinetobacter ursingii]
MSLTQLFAEIERQEWIDLPEGWLQGRTIYGGLAAGVLMHKALVTLNDATKQLLSCSITFIGPVQAGKARLTAEVLRQGKSVTTLEVRLWQHDAVQTILVASFGTLRDSNIQVHHEPTLPDYPPAEQLHPLPFAKMMPECYRHFQLRWAEGAYPIAGSSKPDFGGWARFDPEQYHNRDLSYADFLILTDIWPPGVLPMFKQLAPASSLTWHLTFVRPIQQQRLDWFKYKVVTEYADHGYSTEYAHVWDHQDQLIAICRQTVTIFA